MRAATQTAWRLIYLSLFRRMKSVCGPPSGPPSQSRPWMTFVMRKKAMLIISLAALLSLNLL